ncbi:MAG: bifunctional oligoribonuclease/PAP phosphatase NrnA [Tenericutes bacterium]|nr:bifunctional oligoribonuclease/PAP phosphatase NrnA [Mycoplasmatota bacterium]
MKNKILKYIEEYSTIIIARHKNPDLDAYGSQFGLYYALKEKYPNKEIYAIGDTNNLNSFQDLDIVSEEVYKKSLLIILDTVSKALIEDLIYKNYSKLIFIDHHRNDPDIPFDLAYQVKDASSCSEIVADFLVEKNIPINKESARALYMGIIGDTGRFMYPSTSAKTFRIASILLESGADIAQIHNDMYSEPRRSKQIKNEFFNLVEYTEKNVAYRKNDIEFLNKYDLDTYYVSRGLVNQMAGMDEVKMWVNFTIDRDTSNIMCELRSRSIPVLSVAKKYGGGGHLLACGCTLKSWEDTDKVLSDLDKILEENNG